jgi:hypothetical protein
MYVPFNILVIENDDGSARVEYDLSSSLRSQFLSFPIAASRVNSGSITFVGNRCRRSKHVQLGIVEGVTLGV